MDGSASTSRSPALLDQGTNLTPYITIVILITGVIGGLVLVISVLIFCKYCIKHKKVLKRQPALFSRTDSSYRQYSHYESLDSTSCVEPYSRETCDSTSHQRVALLRSQQDDKDVREPVDEESSIDYVVAKYKESLKDDKERTRRESQAERRASSTSNADAACFGRRDSKRRVSFAALNRRSARGRAASRRRRYTEGDFHHLKTLRVDHPDRPGRVIKQRSIGPDRLQVSTREQRHDAFRRRSVSDDPRNHPLEPGYGHSPSPPEEDLFPVTSAPILIQQYDDDVIPLGYRYQRTEVSVEVHREPSNGSGSVSSRGELASGSRTASPPKLLETASRASSRTRHSISLETVSPTERLAVSLEKRRVKSCESDLHEYDRLEITQFHRGPFYNADYDVMSEGGSPELRSKVRYNDTGSFEEVNEEQMQILDVVSSIEDITMEDDDDTETLNGAQKYRELWNLRATFEEEEDFSDTIRMEDLTSPDEQSPEEQEQATTSELTTSFESNTDPVAEQDEGHDQAEGECDGNGCPGPSQRRKSSSTLLIPQLSYESRRQNYRGILTRRGKRIEMPKANNDNSFDSIETDGEVSEDTSRHEVTTTSFESTTDNTDSTGEAQNPHKLQQMRGDSGYKSLETQQTLGSIDTHTPPGPTPKPVKKQIQFTIEGEDVSSRDSNEYSNLIDTINKPCATSPTEGGLQRSPSQKKTIFERRTAKTASKKRREYGREKQVQYVYESVANFEAETDSKSDQLSGDSFDDIGPPGSGKLSVFTRFFRSQKRRAMQRDFSIDEKTDALFQKFTRYDPHMDKHTLTVRRQSYPTRPRMHRRPTDPDPTGARRRDKLSLEVRSVSMDSDSTCSTDRRHSLAQDSIEEEYQHPEKPQEAEGRAIMPPPQSPPQACRKESIIHDIPIIKLPEGDMSEIC